MTGTSEWEQRSHCGCHTHSSLHSPFALPAVSLFPPTASEPHPPAVAIHQATLNSNAHMQTRRALGGFGGAWLHRKRSLSPPLGALCLSATPTDWLHCWRRDVIYHYHQRLVSVTPLYTATTHKLLLARIFKNIFHFTLSFLPSGVSHCYCSPCPASSSCMPHPFTTMPSPLLTDAPPCPISGLTHSFSNP